MSKLLFVVHQSSQVITRKAKRDYRIGSELHRCKSKTQRDESLVGAKLPVSGEGLAHHDPFRILDRFLPNQGMYQAKYEPTIMSLLPWNYT